MINYKIVMLLSFALISSVGLFAADAGGSAKNVKFVDGIDTSKTMRSSILFAVEDGQNRFIVTFGGHRVGHVTAANKSDLDAMKAAYEMLAECQSKSKK